MGEYDIIHVSTHYDMEIKIKFNSIDTQNDWKQGL